MDEPPSKVTKFEMESQYLDGEVMEEGQEEWLSEGILTDDDYNNPASQPTENDQSDSNIVGQDDTAASFSTRQDDTMPSVTEDGQMTAEVMDTSHIDANIEEALNNFENSESNNQMQELPEELNAFLIRKTDGKVIGGEALKNDSDIDESIKQSDDDGNDTDELLRVLGDGDQKTSDAKKDEPELSDEDDSFIFGGQKSSTYEVAKKSIRQGPATKAVPEDDDVTDCSSDEAEKSTSTKKPPVKPVGNTSQLENYGTKNNIRISSTVKPGNLTIVPQEVRKKAERQVHSPVRKVIINVTPDNHKVKPPLRTYTNKTTTAPPRNSATKLSNSATKVLNSATKFLNSATNVSRNVSKVADYSGGRMIGKTVQRQSDEIINDVEFLEDDSFDLDEDFTQQESRPSKARHTLMKPERMDEEVPSDNESYTDEESLYDELPSSDSDGTDDWFTFDVRAERAADYIPLLGDNAYELLSQEKQRVQKRLYIMKNSLEHLTEMGKSQAEKLKKAMTTVTELDAMLKST